MSPPADGNRFLGWMDGWMEDDGTPHARMRGIVFCVFRLHGEEPERETVTRTHHPRRAAVQADTI